MTPERALEEALARVRTDADGPPSKALILLLWDDKPHQYWTAFYNAGMSTSEMVSLCEVHKQRCLSRLCPPPR